MIRRAVAAFVVAYIATLLVMIMFLVAVAAVVG